MRRQGVGVLVGIAGIVGSWTALSLWGASGSGEKGGGGALPPDPDPHPVSWNDPMEVAAGDAYQGPWRMNESDFRYVDAPTVALDPEGTVAVA